MTENANLVTKSESAGDERLERMLDAATELLVRWGYRRVTIDDVARRAGIGKGTVYLHFRTKEALFLTVLLRGHHAVVGGIAARMRSDPAEVLPGRMMASTYRALAADPVTRAVYFSDTETLGRLAHETAGTLGELAARSDATAREYFTLLRGAGLLRTDQGLEAQRFLFNAVATGFFLDENVLPERPGSPDRAELLEYALDRVLVAGEPLPDRRLAAEVADRYDALARYSREQRRSLVRGRTG